MPYWQPSISKLRGTFHLTHLSGCGLFPTQVVPDVHLSTESSDLNDALTQKVIGLPLQALLHPWLDVIIFIPDPQLDAIWRVVALAAETGGTRSQNLRLPRYFHLDKLNLQAELFLPDRVQVAIDGLCPLLGLSHLDGDIRVTGTCSVLGLETLSTHNW